MYIGTLFNTVSVDLEIKIEYSNNIIHNITINCKIYNEHWVSWLEMNCKQKSFKKQNLIRKKKFSVFNVWVHNHSSKYITMFIQGTNVIGRRKTLFYYIIIIKLRPCLG